MELEAKVVAVGETEGIHLGVTTRFGFSSDRAGSYSSIS
jgi:hypothetical protein